MVRSTWLKISDQHKLDIPYLKIIQAKHFGLVFVGNDKNGDVQGFYFS